MSSSSSLAEPCRTSFLKETHEAGHAWRLQHSFDFSDMPQPTSHLALKIRALFVFGGLLIGMKDDD
jgi:hypothetical protein